MFLCRSLPPLVDLHVPTNRHRTRLCKTCTKPAKPLDLSLPKSETYSGIGRRQSHFSYPQCFQDLSPSKGAFFRKELIACAQPVPAAKRVELGQAKNRSEASWKVACFERDACPISQIITRKVISWPTKPANASTPNIAETGRMLCGCRKADRMT